MLENERLKSSFNVDQIKINTQEPFKIQSYNHKKDTDFKKLLFVL